MHKTRLEAFSDGVMAVLITVLVLELKVPHGHELQALTAVAPVFCVFVLSFVFLGIYWNNHHHLLHATERINGGILWANLHLLFWLSLIPFTTGWMGESHLAAWPTALYGVVLLAAGLAYLILQNSIVKHQGPHSLLAKAIGQDRKGKASALSYAVAVALAFVQPVASAVIYALVAMMWLVPDRRIESMFRSNERAD
jgi:uncharacterized membrane protein